MPTVDGSIRPVACRRGRHNQPLIWFDKSDGAVPVETLDLWSELTMNGQGAPCTHNKLLIHWPDHISQFVSCGSGLSSGRARPAPTFGRCCTDPSCTGRAGLTILPMREGPAKGLRPSGLPFLHYPAKGTMIPCLLHGHGDAVASHRPASGSQIAQIVGTGVEPCGC